MPIFTTYVTVLSYSSELSSSEKARLQLYLGSCTGYYLQL